MSLTNSNRALRHGARRYPIHSDPFVTCTLVYNGNGGWRVEKMGAAPGAGLPHASRVREGRNRQTADRRIRSRTRSGAGRPLAALYNCPGLSNAGNVQLNSLLGGTARLRATLCPSQPNGVGALSPGEFNP
jgi:hypothetical protein